MSERDGSGKVYMTERLARQIRNALGKYNDERLPVVQLVTSLEAKVAELEAENTELRDGWRQGVLQKEINMLPETEAAVHIAELQDRIAELEKDKARLQEFEQRVRSLLDHALLVNTREMLVRALRDTFEWIDTERKAEK